MKGLNSSFKLKEPSKLGLTNYDFTIHYYVFLIPCFSFKTNSVVETVPNILLKNQTTTQQPSK